MRPKTLDHVALWVADRDAITDFLTERLSMHVIERTERFTLVGTDARRGKLTLFAEEGPRERGALKHVALRVNDLEDALGGLEGIEVDRVNGAAYFDVQEGLRLGLVEAETDVEYDLDHVALFSASPQETAREYEQFGFAPGGEARVEVGGAFVEFHDGDARRSGATARSTILQCSSTRRRRRSTTPSRPVSKWPTSSTRRTPTRSSSGAPSA